MRRKGNLGSQSRRISRVSKTKRLNSYTCSMSKVWRCKINWLSRSLTWFNSYSRSSRRCYHQGSFLMMSWTNLLLLTRKTRITSLTLMKRGMKWCQCSLKRKLSIGLPLLSEKMPLFRVNINRVMWRWGRRWIEVLQLRMDLMEWMKSSSPIWIRALRNTFCFWKGGIILRRKT